MLRGIVEDAVLRDRTGLIGALDDLFDRLAFPFGAGDQLVAVVDIGIVVNVMVEFEGFFLHAERSKRVMSIGKIGKFEGHRNILSRYGNVWGE